MHKKKKSVWKKILWLIRPYLHFLMLSFVFAGISALLTLYAPILIGNAVDLILGKGVWILTRSAGFCSGWQGLLL